MGTFFLAIITILVPLFHPFKPHLAAPSRRTTSAKPLNLTKYHTNLKVTKYLFSLITQMNWYLKTISGYHLISAKAINIFIVPWRHFILPFFVPSGHRFSSPFSCFHLTDIQPVHSKLPTLRIQPWHAHHSWDHILYPGYCTTGYQSGMYHHHVFLQ